MPTEDAAHQIKSILIVGGGTAGWLTATILASRFHKPDGSGLAIRLVEAPDIPIIGVGEGTWPGMRSTLRNAGIKEADFLRACQASFKQGSKFVGWCSGEQNDFYYHPFDLPAAFSELNIAQIWVNGDQATSFSELSCAQEPLCEQHLSPKLMSTREYAGATNYGYHLDAGMFSQFLREHCTKRLGVDLVLDRVTKVHSAENGDVDSVETETSGVLNADLFIDCTGFRSLLLGEHYNVPFIDQAHVLPINSAIAVQVPYKADEAIKSATVSTAQSAGWIWDIGLMNRRGVGHVYSAAHTSQDQAHFELQCFLGTDETTYADLNPRSLSIRPGYRAKSWEKNCLAIGLSAGFLEPLEASAMMLIETSANLLADLLPQSGKDMDRVSATFNQKFQYRWERIVDFLKLHYVLSRRTDPFWRDSANHATISDRLKDDLERWERRAPETTSFEHETEVFPSASYQYVLYGMGFETRTTDKTESDLEQRIAHAATERVRRDVDLLSSKLVPNRKILDLISA
ncbi:MAG: tryptophan halogenase family protein [Pseudomonadota bacterium]